MPTRRSSNRNARPRFRESTAVQAFAIRGDCGASFTGETLGRRFGRSRADSRERFRKGEIGRAIVDRRARSHSNLSGSRFSRITPLECVGNMWGTGGCPEFCRGRWRASVQAIDSRRAIGLRRDWPPTAPPDVRGAMPANWSKTCCCRQPAATPGKASHAH